MDRALAVFGILIGLAGAAISLIGLTDEALKDYPAVANHRPTILITSLVISGLSASLLVWTWLTQARDVILSLWEKAQGRRPPELADMKLTEISQGQLDLAYKYISEAMWIEGVSQVLSFEQFRSMWQIDKFIYGILWDRSEPTALRIVGFISIFPLNRPAAERMLSCQLRGSELRAEHLAQGREKPAAYFIGAIAASSWKARGEVVRLLDGAIAELKLQNENPLLLTSPFTTRGRALARKFGFRRLREYPGYGELWSQSDAVRLAEHPTRFRQLAR
jgi:hypothetical protein